MKVKRYKYGREVVDELKWNATNFDWIDLAHLNLFVGRNATGKSTVTNFLTNYSRLFLPSNARFIGTRAIELEDSSGNNYIYSYNGDLEAIQSEQLLRNGEVLFERSNLKARIFSEVKNDFENINPPADKPILHVRRDAKEYPYLEDIAKWAEGIRSFKFGNVHPYGPGKYADIGGGSNEEVFKKALETLKDSDKKKIIKDFNSLGYDLKVIDIRKQGSDNIIFIKEGDLKYELRQNVLSQGMFRSLSLLIYLHYILEKEKATLVIIDDLCEGLDFERATNLGKLVFEKLKNNNIQFVATSNDFFLMNVVDTIYWNILKRDLSEIKVFNYINSREAFEKFKFTGLNNFQLFASSYLDEELK